MIPYEWEQKIDKIEEKINDLERRIDERSRRMLISEKQIITLINLMRSVLNNELSFSWRQLARTLLNEIEEQQSEELKEIE